VKTEELVSKILMLLKEQAIVVDLWGGWHTLVREEIQQRVVGLRIPRKHWHFANQASLVKQLRIPLQKELNEK